MSGVQVPPPLPKNLNEIDQIYQSHLIYGEIRIRLNTLICQSVCDRSDGCFIKCDVGTSPSFQKNRKQLVGEITQLFERFGLKDQMHKYPDQLSGGQQQRVAIVRALAMKPEAMLFDEITSALDPQLVGPVLEVLLKLKEEGMTILMATHEMNFAKKAADKICFLKDGRVLEEGSPDKIFSQSAKKETRSFLSSF